ncbi:MAG: FAD-dependent oxidoreductase [Pseudobacter sp.]|uniref:FAD-dependent oxidoreductase n=1 Tax=Pseudobacter sp. TaxID=2045420 RepID=UPI003F816C1C
MNHNLSPDGTTGNFSSGENHSYWIDAVAPVEITTLSQDMETDVLVVGGGIAGLTTAYLLAKAGRIVTLVEDGLIGSGESGRTTAHITCALDDHYQYIEKAFGEEGAKLAAASHMAAIEKIASIIREEHIACDFERLNGYLFLFPGEKKQYLADELEAVKRAGIPAQWMDEIPGMSPADGPCIVYPMQAQFHIMRYLHELAHVTLNLGAKIFTKTRATKIDKHGAVCNGFTIKAQHIVVATNTPVNDLVTMHTKQFPYRTYVIAAPVPKGTLPRSLWWDTGDQDSKWVTAPYHYIRTQAYTNTHDLLIIGGEDHKTGRADEEKIPETSRYQALINWMRVHFPAAGDVVYHWSGQVMEPIDYMGFIGRNPGNENIYIITGDSGNGMTHGTIGAMILFDLIQDKANPWAELYSPKRLPMKELGTYLSEVMDMAKQYGDYFTEADIKSLDELAPGNGAILGKGMKRIAVYKNENGKVNACSAVCPHLGCVVQWNADEKSFDCPCHGSRFTKEGEVINGPAVTPLKRIDINAGKLQ